MVVHKLKKGYNIKLAGRTDSVAVDGDLPKFFALQPPDFLGLRPRLKVDIGTPVKIGSELFIDKTRPDIKFVSPASGQVVQINRGTRRIIIEVVIESDGKDDYEFFDVYDMNKIEILGREEIIKHLLETGVWPYIRQRPFSKIADPNATPRDIFICAMDTAPLAPDQNLLLEGEEESFQAGVSTLSKLTSGKVYLSLDGNYERLAPALDKVEGVEKHSFTGPHPVGNVSVHIHHISPLNTGQNVWYVYAPDVALIGRLFLEGKYPVERLVAVAGSSVKEETRKYYKTRLGSPVQSLVAEGELVDFHARYISGNVLSGRRITENGYLGFYDRLLTVIPDSRRRELFGWFKPGLKEESFSRLFLSKLIPQKEYIRDTRTHGGKRAFVQTGEYEKVVPMDIFPSHLVKSIMAEEIEDMIGLGLLEVDEEDFALCSYICPSKIDFGKHIRDGLDILEKEG
jgi:Na+-transporting NADH:ubiquinone oxidoreductase subunit A